MDELEDRLDRNTVVAHRYRIVRFAGNRGFGQVYQAEDGATESNVSLMRLDREFSRPENRERFFATRGSARIDHPAAVDLTDYGEDLDGRFFLVMPWIEGAEALDELLTRQRKLGWAHARGLIEGIARALSAAHARGILHGGLEPSRVLVDANGQPHVLDFGLAPAFETAANNRSNKPAPPITDTRVLAGKPAYMPPELVRGDRPNERTDIYALGLLFWELIAGSPPFTGDPVDTLHRQVHDPLPELVRGDAPVEVEALLHIALAKDPEERFASIEELLETLRPLPGASAAPKPLPRTPTVPITAAKAQAVSGQIAAPPPPAKPKTGPQPSVVAAAAKPKTGPQPAVTAAAAAKPKTGPQPAVTAAAAKPVTGPQPAVTATAPAKPVTGPQPALTVAATKPITGPQPVVAVAAKPATGPQPIVAAPMIAAEPAPIAAPPEPRPTARTGPVAPVQKRRFGLLERAIAGFLLFDLALFGAWQLLGNDDKDESEVVEASAPTDSIAAAEPSPAPEQKTAPEPAAIAEPTIEAPVDEPTPDSDLEPAPALAGLPNEPLPKQLSVADFRKTMVDARDDLVASCLDDQRMRRTFKVSIAVAPSGRVEWATVLEAPGKTALGKCISKETRRRVQFPPTEEGGSHVYSLRLR